MTNDEYLIVKACQDMLNDLPRRLLNHSMYKDTYQLASAVDIIIGSHEHKMSTIMEDADCEQIRDRHPGEPWDIPYGAKDI